MVILEFLNWQARAFKLATTESEKLSILSKTMRAAACEAVRLSDAELQDLQLYCEQMSTMTTINNYAESMAAINALSRAVAQEIQDRYLRTRPELSEEERRSLEWVTARGLNRDKL